MHQFLPAQNTPVSKTLHKSNKRPVAHQRDLHRQKNQVNNAAKNDVRYNKTEKKTDDLNNIASKFSDMLNKLNTDTTQTAKIDKAAFEPIIQPDSDEIEAEILGHYVENTGVQETELGNILHEVIEAVNEHQNVVATEQADDPQNVAAVIDVKLANSTDIEITNQSEENVKTQPISLDKLLSKIIEKLQNISIAEMSENGIDSNAVVDILTRVKNALENISNLTENGQQIDKTKLDGDIEKTINKFFNQYGKSDLEAKMATKGQLELSDQDFEIISKLLNDKNIDLQIPAIKQSLKTQANQTSNNDLTTQQVTPAVIATEQNKYAGRYDNPTTETPKEPGESTPNLQNPTAAYDSVKASLIRNHNAANDLSALDKINSNNPLDFLNQLQANQNNQSLNLTSQDNDITLKLSLQNGRLSQNLPINNMAFQMAKQFSRGNSEFQIRLDPAELGKINIKLSLKQGGAVKAHMVVERSDVFELLQRDARALERALSDAGFDGEQVDVKFSLDQNANNGKEFAKEFFENLDDKHNNTNEADDLEDSLEDMVASHTPLHLQSSNIDRKV